MSPSRVEVYIPAKDKWQNAGELSPESPPGTLPDNTEGGREIIVFDCKADDSKTVIYRSERGVDIRAGESKEIVVEEDKLKVVSELKKGESHTFKITTDSGFKSTVRISHI